jgi:hypothetical protein
MEQAARQRYTLRYVRRAYVYTCIYYMTQIYLHGCADIQRTSRKPTVPNPISDIGYRRRSSLLRHPVHFALSYSYQIGQFPVSYIRGGRASAIVYCIVPLINFLRQRCSN